MCTFPYGYQTVEALFIENAFPLLDACYFYYYTKICLFILSLVVMHPKRHCPSLHSFSKCLLPSVLGEVKARCQELRGGLLYGGRDPAIGHIRPGSWVALEHGDKSGGEKPGLKQGNLIQNVDGRHFLQFKKFHNLG